MQYLLLIYDNETRWTSLDQAGLESEIREYGEYGKEFAGKILGGNALHPTGTAKTVRVRDGQCLTTDGPFAETKEQLGGYYLVEAGSLDEAIAMAAKIPWSRYGSIEVRPILKFSAASAGLSPAEVEKGRSYLERTRQGVIAATDGLSEAQWTFTSGPDRWSIAQVLEHMVVVQELVLGPIVERLARSPVTVSRDASVVDALTFDRLPDRTRTFPAPPAAHPSGRWAPSEAIDRLCRNCSRLIERLETTPDLRQHQIESPPLKAVTNGTYNSMDGYQWILAAAAHTDRHTRQILEVKAAAGFPTA